MNSQKGGISYFDSDVLGLAGFTWNPVTGCTKGCPECWARDVSRNRLAPANEKEAKKIAATEAKWGDKYPDHPNWPKSAPRFALVEAYRTFKPTLHPERLNQPAKRKKPAVIGVCFMGDLFDAVLKQDALRQVTSAAFEAPQHTFIFLTKRPDRMAAWFVGVWNSDEWNARKKNWFLGFSARTQAEFDAGWPHMAKLAAAGWKVWVSLEPLQGPVDMWPHAPFLSGVIVGAQSGKDAPGLNTDWVRSIRDQCAAAEVDFMYKQGPNEAGKLVTLPDLDGVKHTALAWGQNVS